MTNVFIFDSYLLLIWPHHRRRVHVFGGPKVLLAHGRRGMLLFKLEKEKKTKGYCYGIGMESRCHGEKIRRAIDFLFFLLFYFRFALPPLFLDC